MLRKVTATGVRIIEDAYTTGPHRDAISYAIGRLTYCLNQQTDKEVASIMMEAITELRDTVQKMSEEEYE